VCISPQNAWSILFKEENFRCLGLGVEKQKKFKNTLHFLFIVYSVMKPVNDRKE